MYKGLLIVDVRVADWTGSFRDRRVRFFKKVELSFIPTAGLALTGLTTPVNGEAWTDYVDFSARIYGVEWNVRKNKLAMFAVFSAGLEKDIDVPPLSEEQACYLFNRRRGWRRSG